MNPSLKVLVTCGPTREPLDPVRFLSNRSTGVLGVEIAKAFAARGHRVVLAAGPIELPKYLGSRIRVTRFETARDLHRIALKEFLGSDAVCMTAAVADFRPEKFFLSKIKRGKAALTVRLVPNPDILADLGRRKKPGQVLVGFSVESGGLQPRGRKKLLRKNLDLLAAQTVGRGRSPFGAVPIDTLLMDRTGSEQKIRGTSKRDLARRIVSRVEALKRSR